ncbi:MAG: arginase [Chloroflexi bacterium]|nr:arginase [Chloroflexota bacterium]
MGGPYPGPELGPKWIRAAGLIGKLEADGFEVWDLGDVENPPVGLSSAPELRGMDTMGVLTRGRVEHALQKGMFPVVIGGDHGTALGPIAASAAHHPTLGILWVDAHPDFNTLESSTTKNPHGMVLALAAGLGPRSALESLGRVPLVPPRRIAILGARSIDDAERTLLDQHEVRCSTTDEILRFGLVESADEAIRYLKAQGAEAIHLSIDLDILNPANWPGVSTPVDGGLSFDELVTLVAWTMDEANVVSIDVSELNPNRDRREQTTEAAVAVIQSAVAAL